MYVLLLMAMALFDWYFALRVQRAQREEKNAKLWVALACVVNLGLIGFFKYAGMVCSIFGDVPAFVQRIALPLGISFYTFQLLSYVVDVYRGDAEAQDKYWHVLLRRALPQCIAGPSSRYKTIAKELFDGRNETADRARGCTRFAVGLAKKTVLANACGALADSLLLTDAAIGSASQLAENPRGAFQRAGACALDRHNCVCVPDLLAFSAYSDMAIGMGQMIGLHYLRNFNYPYISRTATEFWRRWHMSLGTFSRGCASHPARQQPGRKSARVPEPLHRLGAYRPLARGELELCALGLYYFVLMLDRLFWRKLLDKLPKAVSAILSHITLPLAVLFGWVLFKFIAPARCSGRARHVLRQRQRLYELHRYGGDKEPYVSAHLLRRGGNAGVFVSCEALGARRRGERTCAEKLFRCRLWRCAGFAAASEHCVPCRQQL